MMDDPLEWLALALDDDEPTIPDALAWHDPPGFDDQTQRTGALDDDESPEAEWELELESELRPALRASHG